MTNRPLSFFFLLLFLGAGVVQAQPADSLIVRGQRLLTRGYRAGDVGAIQQARAAFDRATASQAHAGRAHYYVALADYRLVALLQDDEDARDRFLDDGVKHAEAAVARRSGDGEAYALLASLYGWKAAGGMLSGMRYGPKSSRAMSRATDLAPASPRVVLLDAIGTYNKPSLFGGDKEAALEGFQRAARLFEQEEAAGAKADPLAPRWGHADAYAWMGLAHAQAGRPNAARAAYERALDVAPDFGWVRDVLMPRLAARP
jgi:tetratricopeptide (TPR) repeat protein